MIRNRLAALWVRENTLDEGITILRIENRSSLLGYYETGR